jgi:hypothetical protein
MRALSYAIFLVESNAVVSWVLAKSVPWTSLGVLRRYTDGVDRSTANIVS